MSSKYNPKDHPWPSTVKSDAIQWDFDMLCHRIVELLNEANMNLPANPTKKSEAEDFAKHPAMQKWKLPDQRIRFLRVHIGIDTSDDSIYEVKEAGGKITGVKIIGYMPPWEHPAMRDHDDLKHPGHSTTGFSSSSSSSAIP